MASIVDLHNLIPLVSSAVIDPHYVFVFSVPASTDEGWQPWFQEWLKALAPLGTVVVGFMMWLIARNQHKISQKQQDLMHSQLEILKEQKNIALQQKMIAKQKLALDMNNRQYEIFSNFSDAYHDFFSKMFTGSVNDLERCADEILRLSKLLEHSFGDPVYNLSVRILRDVTSVAKKRLSLEMNIINKVQYEEYVGDDDKNGCNIFFYSFSDAVNLKLKVGFNTDFFDGIKDV